MLSRLDIITHAFIYAFITKNKTNTLINYEACTSIDKSDSELNLVSVINHLVIADITQIERYKSIKVIQISTDYVFGGKV